MNPLVKTRTIEGLALEALTLVLCCAALACTGADAGGPDYPQWRGQNRDGSASAFIEPTEWPEALVRKWNVQVGEGYATPLVVGNAVYSFTRREGDEVMAALDAETGEELWRTGYALPFTPGRPTAGHGRAVRVNDFETLLDRV